MESGSAPPPEVLGRLPGEDRRAVLAIATRRCHRSGEVIVFEGDQADALYLVVSGRVAVRASTPDGDVVTLTVLGPGDTFGEVALLGGYARRTASVQAREPVETLVIGRHDFDALRARRPGIERFLVETLARQVARLTTQLSEALYVPVETRLARRLLDLAGLFGGDVSLGRPVTIPVTQSELATMAGTSRQTCNRILHQMAEHGVVLLLRGRTEVVDPDALRRLAAG